MTGRYLLDTSVVIALFAEDPAVLALLDGSDECLTPQREAAHASL